MGGVTTRVHTFSVPLPDLTDVPVGALWAAAAVAWYMVAAVVVTRPGVTDFLLRLTGHGPPVDAGDRYSVQVLAWASSPATAPGYLALRAAHAAGHTAVWALSLGLLARAPWAGAPTPAQSVAPAAEPAARADRVDPDELGRFRRLRLWPPGAAADAPANWLWVDAWAVDGAYPEADGAVGLLICGTVRRVCGDDPWRVLGYLYGRYPDPGYPLPTDARSI